MSRIKPGESLTLRFALTRIVDVSLGGEYKVKVTYSSSYPSHTGEVTSNTVSFTQTDDIRVFDR